MSALFVTSPASSIREADSRCLVEPVQRLRDALDDILDVDGHPDRDPEEAMAVLRRAVDEFQAETEDWWAPALITAG